ncbi:MAG: Vps16, N-terminal region-domain-containing protein, partial [Olpidium bornovanus]
MQFHRTLLMVGPFGDWLKYEYDDHVHVIPEIDGVRIVGPDKCEFLQKVPDATEDVFKVGSTAPAAMLYDALEHFEVQIGRGSPGDSLLERNEEARVKGLILDTFCEPAQKKSPKVDENIRNIRTDLTEAVDVCIEAAGHEFSQRYQRSLLKVRTKSGHFAGLMYRELDSQAASFGKFFLDLYDADNFVSMVQTLRVLNAVRYYEVGIPLTTTQYARLTPDALIARLMNRHHHLLAVRICEYLKMRTDRVLIHWACAKVKKSVVDEDTVCRVITERLANKPYLGYAEIAKTAYKVGQPKLATKVRPLLLSEAKCVRRPG